MLNKAEYINGNAVFNVPVKKLAELRNPVEDGVWGFGIQPSNLKIRNCIAKGKLLGWQEKIKNLNTYDHAARIAYLVVNPSDEPISVEFCNGVVVDDGNHRLAAAIYAERETIRAAVGGFCDVAEEALGIKF